MSHSSPPSSNLPWEVIENIIDLSCLNVDVLRHFALTCRTLLPRSRSHLFYAVRLEPTQQDIDALSKIFDLNPWLALLVRIVAVYSRFRFGVVKSFVGVVPVKLFKRLPHLHHWRLLTGVTRSAKTPLSFHSTTLVFLRTARIQVLDIKGLTFTSNAELARMLASLPLLQALRCSNIRVKSQSTMAVGLSTRRRSHRSLRSIRVRSMQH